MTNPRGAVCFLAVLLLACVPTALAQGTYTQIDVPGATVTACTGIDAAGDLVGVYMDSAGKLNGFLLSGGTYSTIDDQGQGTSLRQINDIGTQIVGVSAAGFVYDIETQTFTDVHDPSGYSTTPTSINNAGTVVGYYYMPHQGVYRGFELVGSTYTDINPPGSATVQLYGISSSGKIVGFEGTRHGTESNFSYSQGKYQKIHIPNAPLATVYGGINPAGNAVVGYYSPSTGMTAGFLYQNQTLTTLQFPGSNTTFAAAINSGGEVTGFFFDANGKEHGFTWTPPADAAKK
jgi:hypothetical protein